MAEKKSLTKNMLIQGLKTVITFLTPLITFPYISRVLSVDLIGKVNFSSSIVGYFVLLAEFGISSYAIKNGAKYRDDKVAFDLFVSEMFTFKLITTIISYCFFFFMLFINTKWQEYTLIMLMISINMFITAIGLEWVFTLLEDYVYLALRSIFVQFLSIIYLFVFVKTDKDLYFYVFYAIFSTVITNLINFIVIKKKIKLRLYITNKILKDIKPIFFIFISSLAVEIYLYSDTTILGYITNDTEVGLYNAAVKIYTLVKNVLLTIASVSMPRLAYIYSNLNIDEYKTLFYKLFNIIILLALPCVFGIYVLGTDGMLLLAGDKYISAGIVLKLLCVSIVPSVLCTFISSGYLIIHNKTGYICFSTTISALTNIILNFLLVPKLGSIGAAITTIIAETLCLILYLMYIRNDLSYKKILVNIFQVFIASIVMFMVCILIHQLIYNLAIRVIVTIIIGSLVYAITLIMLRNKIMDEMFKQLKSKNLFYK